MAYDRVKIFEQAKSVIVKNKLFFIEDVVAFLPISKPTFYEFFQLDSNEFNELKELLEEQKITIKTSMRSKWYKSDNATLQLSLMKLICSDDERQKLSMTHIDHTTKGEQINIISLGSGINPNESTT